jgi:hypothetical protein
MIASAGAMPQAAGRKPVNTFTEEVAISDVGELDLRKRNAD